MSVKRLIVIPTYNESENIARLISEILGLALAFDVLVIDDNSPDGTSDKVIDAFKENGRVFLIKRLSKLGLGSAYMSGFKWAKEKGYDRIFTMDADFSHQPKYLPQLDAMLDDNDLSIGSRYVEGGSVENWPFARRLLSRFGNYYARKVMGMGIKDCTSGFMGMSRALLENIERSGIRSEGYSFMIELKHIAASLGVKTAELPIAFADRKAGLSKISKKIIFEAFLLALKLRFRLPGSTGRGNRLLKVIDFYIGVPVVCLLGIFLRKKTPRQDPKEIVVIKLSAMGDSILLIPSLRALRGKYPDSSITVVCTGINDAIFRNCSYVNSVIVCDVKNILKKPISLFSLYGGKQYDLAIDFDQWLRLSPILAALSGAPVRIGFKTEGQFRHYSYSDFVLHDRRKHEVDCFLELLTVLKIANTDNKLEFAISETAMRKAIELFKMILVNEHEAFVVMHPETPAHGGQRHWPQERYIEIGKRITEDYRLKIIVTGTKNEIDSNVKIVSAIGPNAKLLPPADILVVAAVLSKAKAVVCGNTGIMHLACALHRPVVAIHGPTDPVKWGPRGENCRVVRAGLKCSPCLYLGFEYGCDNNACMEAVSTDDVLKSLKEVAFSS